MRLHGSGFYSAVSGPGITFGHRVYTYPKVVAIAIAEKGGSMQIVGCPSGAGDPLRAHAQTRGKLPSKRTSVFISASKTLGPASKIINSRFCGLAGICLTAVTCSAQDAHTSSKDLPLVWVLRVRHRFPAEARRQLNCRRYKSGSLLGDATSLKRCRRFSCTPK